MDTGGSFSGGKSKNPPLTIPEVKNMWKYILKGSDDGV
jgi:hypothetical protein